MSLKWSFGTQDLCTIRVLYRANACNRTLDDLQLSLRDLSSKDSESNPGLLDLETIIIEHYDIVFVIIYSYENSGAELKKNVFNRVLI